MPERRLPGLWGAVNAGANPHDVLQVAVILKAVEDAGRGDDEARDWLEAEAVVLLGDVAPPYANPQDVLAALMGRGLIDRRIIT